MTKRKAPKKTPMQQALADLYELESGTGLATAEQLLQVAQKHDLPVWQVEGVYLEDADRRAEE
jgi:hypothetical protein